jgi:hypothetical protein
MKVASLSIAAVSVLAGQAGAQLSSVSRLGQTTSAAGLDAEERHLQTCKRQTKPKRTKACKEENPYNGLQDLNIIAPDQTPNQAAISRCIVAFQSSGWDVFDFANYANWIDDDTTMAVADTGFWSGVDGILEYVQLVLAPGPCERGTFFTNAIPVVGSEGFLPITAEGDECTLLFSSKVTFQNSCVFSGDLDTIVGNRYSFTILDDTSSQASIHMNRIDVYLPHGMLAYMATALKTVEYATAICNTMQSSCSETFENSCYNAPGVISGIDKCVDDLMSLPATDNTGPSLNGKSFGCRVLHSSLAASNKKHCPHISFGPEFDSKCFVKCQQAANITNADMFHPMELGFMAVEADSNGLPDAQWEYTVNE